MLQKLLVNVESSKPLQSYGDGHVLLFNETSQNYYATTREALFAVQDAKIKSLEEEIEKFKKNEKEKNDAFIKKVELILNNYQTNITNKVNNFTNTMSEKENKFLKQYQETNAKLIDMVKKLIIEE